MGIAAIRSNDTHGVLFVPAFSILGCMMALFHGLHTCEGGKDVANMAKNAPIGDNHRNGAMRYRTQSYNPVTGNWTKRDTAIGRFMDCKQDGTPFKGVRKESIR